MSKLRRGPRSAPSPRIETGSTSNEVGRTVSPSFTVAVEFSMSEKRIGVCRLAESLTVTETKERTTY